MNVNGKHYRTIWEKEDNPRAVEIIDQRYLPHNFVIEQLNNWKEVAIAIKEMHVRGAGLIGATAGYGMYLATLENAEDNFLEEAGKQLKATRPTAVNLAWAVDRQLAAIKRVGEDKLSRILSAHQTAKKIADEDTEYCRKLGEYGVKIIEEIYQNKKDVVNIETHCNAGWLAFVDYGSALSPIYVAHEKGIPVHVWVDITGPWNQGAKLTAWELGQQGIPHTIIADNTGGHLMQIGKVDMMITGADRVAINGDAANKIGTYLKAVVAKDNNIPFYIALPSSTFDWNIGSGKEIPIEERGSDEVKYASGLTKEGKIEKVLLTPENSPALNYGFDVTPARLIEGLITERGICKADKESILNLFPEHKK
jgi:methylthioribose-1-phosphate isomerase